MINLEVLKRVKDHFFFVFILSSLFSCSGLALIETIGLARSPTKTLLFFILILFLQTSLLFANRIFNSKYNEPFIANGLVVPFHRFKIFAILLSPMTLIFMVTNQFLLLVISSIIICGFCWYRNYLTIKAVSTYTKKYIKDNDIEHLVFTNGRKDDAYQVNQWVPVFEKSQHLFAIVVKNWSIAKAINSEIIPVFVAPSIRSMERLLDLNPRSILYTGNPMQNVNFLRFSQLKHIFINHGESDKVVNQNKLMAAYDHLLVGGQLAVDRLVHAGFELRSGQAIQIGRPQTEISLNKKLRGHGPIKKILYAPTWEGFADSADYSSIRPDGLNMLKLLAKNPDYEVKIKFHPLTGSKKSVRSDALRDMRNLSKKLGIEVLSSPTPIEELMNWSDAMICDISSVLNEYLYTNKPIILTAFDELIVENLKDNFPSSKACYVMTDPSMIDNIVDSANETDLKMNEARQNLLEYSLSVSEGSSLTRFDDALSKATN